jgi:hypothetical protein
MDKLVGKICRFQCADLELTQQWRRHETLPNLGLVEGRCQKRLQAVDARHFHEHSAKVEEHYGNVRRRFQF